LNQEFKSIVKRLRIVLCAFTKTFRETESEPGDEAGGQSWAGSSSVEAGLRAAPAPWEISDGSATGPGDPLASPRMRFVTILSWSLRTVEEPVLTNTNGKMA
jgi:hypothetical protein